MRREGKEVQSFFFLVNEHISPSAGMGGGRHGGGGGGVVGVVLGHLGGYSVREWRTDKLIWPASWLHLRRLSRSPCHWGRCWWTLHACRRCSGTSRWRSSLWGCQSHGTSWLPPGGRHQKLELSPNWALYSLETPSILSAICISSELI